MSRPSGHAAVRPFRITGSAIEAHSGHAPTPFLGCPLCIRSQPMKGVEIRWSSPRLG
jgi:hypothetical protein